MVAAAGAIVKSGATATDVPKGQMEENARSAETLFESRKVDEIRDVEKRTIREAEDKEEELRRGAAIFIVFPCCISCILLFPSFSSLSLLQPSSFASLARATPSIFSAARAPFPTNSNAVDSHHHHTHTQASRTSSRISSAFDRFR